MNIYKKIDWFLLVWLLGGMLLGFSIAILAVLIGINITGGLI